jgi:hypothetical protein
VDERGRRRRRAEAARHDGKTAQIGRLTGQAAYRCVRPSQISLASRSAVPAAGRNAAYGFTHDIRSRPQMPGTIELRFGRGVQLKKVSGPVSDRRPAQGARSSAGYDLRQGHPSPTPRPPLRSSKAQTTISLEMTRRSFLDQDHHRGRTRRDDGWLHPPVRSQ